MANVSISVSNLSGADGGASLRSGARSKGNPAARVLSADGRGRKAIPLFIILGLSLTGMAISKRAQVVNAIPGSARLFAALGLPVNIYQAEIQNVRALLESGAGTNGLSVQGEIRNLLKSSNKIHDLQLSLVGKDGIEAYTWVAQLPEKSLKPHETLSFRVTLESPPPGAQNVVVRFAK